MPSTSQHDSKDLLDPSTFQLPEDYEENSHEYEIWSVKAPIKFDMSTLDKTTFQFNLTKDKKTGADQAATIFEVDGEKYSLSQGHQEEISSFRILAGTEDEDGKGMKPLPVSFNKHFNLIQTTNANIVDVDLAPSNERAPALDMEKVQMRVPYVPIPQKTGLKRRWNVMGANATWTPPEKPIAQQPVEKAEPETPKEAKSKSSKKSKKGSKSEKKKKVKKSKQ
jgi:hypothetical protein